MTEIELPKPLLLRRHSSLLVEDGTVAFRLREWFGDGAFSTPLRNVGVFAWDGTEPEQRGVVLTDIPLVPYVWTSHYMIKPTLLVLFREPVALPPLTRALAFVSRMAQDDRNPYGEPAPQRVDGLRLHVRDPRGTADVLADGGAERVTDVATWLETYRTVPTWAHMAEPGPEWLVSRRRRNG